ncbi:transposase family protein [Streptomyces sp. NPDC056488]|uniref:transposase family protein n=1 Tax=unclassified Streptomyces TaxID=2593676 RepID=UPI0036C3714E
MVDVPHELVERVSRLICARRRERRSRWRKLSCFRQALLVLAHLRKNETPPAPAAGFGVSTATAWRHVDETLDVLAAWAPGLHEALTGLDEVDHVIVDGTLIPIDRIAADEPYYSMKHRKHGMNVQVTAHPGGTPCGSRAQRRAAPTICLQPGPTAVVQACLTRQILVLADRAYQGAGATVRTPYKNHREKPEHYQQFNRDHARLRAPGERAFAQLKSWRILRQVRCSTRRIGTIVQAVHTLLTCNHPG